MNKVDVVDAQFDESAAAQATALSTKEPAPTTSAADASQFPIGSGVE
jgi:hypothetical protein